MNLDSKQLYIAATYFFNQTMVWDKEWTYFGDGDAEIKGELINELTENFLSGEFLNLIHGRRDSGRYKRSEVKRRMIELLMKEDFELWNDALTRVVRFKRMGVLMSGRKDEN